jgi:hypothetical protein
MKVASQWAYLYPPFLALTSNATQLNLILF